MANSTLKIAVAALLVATLCAPSIMGQTQTPATRCKASCEKATNNNCTDICGACFTACDFFRSTCEASCPTKDDPCTANCIPPKPQPDVCSLGSSPACPNRIPKCLESCHTQDDKCTTKCGKADGGLSCINVCEDKLTDCTLSCTKAHKSCLCDRKQASCHETCLKPRVP